MDIHSTLEIIYPSEEHEKKSEIRVVMEMGIYMRQ